MENIYIYGTGSKALKFLPALALKYQIIGFLDSDLTRKGQFLLGVEIFHPSSLPVIHYDHIVIASSYIDEINKTLLDNNLKAGILIEQLPNILQLNKDYTQLENHYREQSTEYIPRIPLLQQHIEQARLITDRQELLQLLPKGGTVAELGVANGDYTKQILNISAPKKLHLIDIWQSERYNETLFQNVCKKFGAELSKGQVQIHRKLSVEAADDFPDHYFDWIYIDTTHCYKGTKAELETYASKIKPGGIIAGHDYTMGNWNSQFRYGVMEAVHEFCVKQGWRIKYMTMDLSENQSFAIEKIN
ncbi:class I SAM-dependent methyltransferase [Rheinheimera sp. MMS21-TC3]|uniref:class I SAM-dependent methyltransferase n=1 Tax=Rheinheimera sp. MMS21-TC3 TaxID=3072790 RepID=UPI0028C46EA1|nr:class I SAM-dependent methyltransferase [Rheinheimera sp. MMS21-TC3]WNO61811.1 class I SAM-dependent methyltransferase [Rheinheimera sp. MMS21-TC3]